MSLKHFVQATLTLAMFGTAMALGAASPAAAESPSYPWCAQGSIIRCWYMTREQCEEWLLCHRSERAAPPWRNNPPRAVTLFEPH